LCDIEDFLQANNKTLKKIAPSMPYPNEYIGAQLGNKLIYDEKNYDKEQLHQEYEKLYASLTGKYTHMLLT
jgi:secreted Zn-dependent insulinase-like peptidase